MTLRRVFRKSDPNRINPDEKEGHVSYAEYAPNSTLYVGRRASATRPPSITDTSHIFFVTDDGLTAPTGPTINDSLSGIGISFNPNNRNIGEKKYFRNNEKLKINSLNAG